MTDDAITNDDGFEDDNDQTLPVFFLFFLVLLAVVLLFGRALHNRPRLNAFLSEPAMVLLISASISFLVKIYFQGEEDIEDEQEQVRYDDYYAYDDGVEEEGEGMYNIDVDTNQLEIFLLTFSEEIFFMVFLPPILFNSGYELKRELFFRHLRPIVSFAVIGTAFSGIVTGLILYGVTLLGWTGEVSPNVWELLTFGSLITATDTVSVLGVLNAKQVNPHLFSLVFGESAFNDAVAIVMFKSFSRLVRMGGFSDKNSLYDEVIHFCVEFLFDVLACPLIGLTISFLAALVFKAIQFDGTPVLELSLYLLLIYIPFILAEVLGLSGIITIFVTGMFARRYIEPNVTDETKHNAEVIFNLVAYLAETCIFLNLGLSVCGYTGNFHCKFIFFAFAASLIGRAMSIYPISFLYNFYLTERMVSPPSIYDCRRPTIDMVTSEDMQEDIELAIARIKNYEESTKQEIADDNYAISTGEGPQIVRRTPEKNLDKVIPVKFMHFLWFAGLRGAVAYACARDFPDMYGNKNDIVSATMVIVFFSIIVMGACCEPLLHRLKIRMGVDNEEYMKEWRNRRSLNGRFHKFEKKFIYDIVVRNSTSGTDGGEILNKTSFSLYDNDDWIHKSYSQSSERATTANATARTLTGSSTFDNYVHSYGNSPTR